MTFYEKSTIKPLYDKFIASLTPDAIADDNELLYTLENIYWYKVNVNRENSLPEFNYTIEYHLSKLALDICKYGALLHSKIPTIEEKVTKYMETRSAVPITAIAVLDKSMNYVLLVQSYFGFEDSWTFPKGERGIKETPVYCATKYADLFLSYNVKKKLAHNVVIEKKIGKHPVKLLIATDANMDYKFQPKIERAIHKIQWFSIWDLPRGKDDTECCARLEMSESHFTSVAPFVSDIQDFIHQSRRGSNPQSSSDIGNRNTSAFMPVIPKKLSGGNLNQSNSSFSTLQNVTLSPLSVNTNEASDSDSVFKPLTISNQCSPITQQSFTGMSFLNLVTNSTQQFEKSASNESTPPQHTVIKHPKAIQPSKLKILVYECQEKRQILKEEENATMDETAELCRSTCESILQTPAVEKKPFPADVESSLTRGSVPYEPVSTDPEDVQFNRTPRSSRRRGTRPRRKTRKSQNEDVESISPTRPDDLLMHVHEQGININVGNILRETTSPKSRDYYSSDNHLNPDFYIYPNVPTYMPFSSNSGQVLGNYSLFPSSSTPVKEADLSTNQQEFFSKWNYSPNQFKNGNANCSSKSTEFYPIKAWENFKLDTQKLVNVYNESIKNLCNV